jgi:Heparinase II/III-like protein/Heparinase II/III N-terminus
VSGSQVSRLGWYARRMARMSPAELAWRARDRALQLAWTPRQVRPGQADVIGASLPGQRGFSAVLPAGTAGQVPDQARAAVLDAADRLLKGEWEVLGATRTDLVQPDWFADPLTGRRSEPGRYSFRIDHRSQEQTGNIKQVWEISRLQHLTLLATAWYLAREEAYADRVASQLRSWWRENPFLSGVHWTSGIELGIRLISLAWIRRLLDEWPGVTGLFERNPLAVRQVRWHQQYLAAFRSRGSSANNHVIAEAAGQLVASCAFGWFPESGRWRRASAALLERELVRNTFPSGIGRELAADYQCFVAELGFLAAAEADACGHPVSTALWDRLAAMTDSAAALMDERSRPPRQGDSDDGRGLLLDAPVPNRWPALLALGQALVGRLDWWPPSPAGAESTIVGALAPGPRDIGGRPARRPSRFADAGITLLRSSPEEKAPEIWCRCDGGPHGFLSIAAHAHADALSVEVRYGGVDILADPGTYCYHGDPPWRSYFRSTIGHNTVELAGRNQSVEGGPFLWVRHARASEISVTDDGEVSGWTAEHDGYTSLDPPARHRRSVRLDRGQRRIEIVDEITGGRHDVRLAFHCGPDVEAELDEALAVLRWPRGPAAGTARLELPPQLRWSLHNGETGPILGWYAHGLGRRVPAFTLLGRGRPAAHDPLRTTLTFSGDAGAPITSPSARALSWNASAATGGQTDIMGAEA